jgi:AraC family transcriptional regulator
MSNPTIVRKEVGAQPILLIRRMISRETLAAALGECFGKLFSMGYAAGLPISGQPIARYVSMTTEPWTVEAAMPLAAPATGTLGDPEIQSGELPAGPVAFAVHSGPYQTLHETHAAIQRWIGEHGYVVAGPPWESYVTDPGQYPDPADWKTEVFWPLRS